MSGGPTPPSRPSAPSPLRTGTSGTQAGAGPSTQGGLRTGPRWLPGPARPGPRAAVSLSSGSPLRPPSRCLPVPVTSLPHRGLGVCTWAPGRPAWTGAPAPAPRPPRAPEPCFDFLSRLGLRLRTGAWGPFCAPPHPPAAKAVLRKELINSFTASCLGICFPAGSSGACEDDGCDWTAGGGVNPLFCSRGGELPPILAG